MAVITTSLKSQAANGQLQRPTLFASIDHVPVRLEHGSPISAPEGGRVEPKGQAHKTLEATWRTASVSCYSDFESPIRSFRRARATISARVVNSDCRTARPKDVSR